MIWFYLTTGLILTILSGILVIKSLKEYKEEVWFVIIGHFCLLCLSVVFLIIASYDVVKIYI